jgi:hypothetical protein
MILLFQATVFAIRAHHLRVEIRVTTIEGAGPAARPDTSKVLRKNSDAWAFAFRVDALVFRKPPNAVNKRRTVMILSALTLFHVILSLVAIGSGFVVMYELLASKWSDGWAKLFLATAVATSVTGFLFPVHHFLPSHAVGILSLIVLGFAIRAFNRYRLVGGWRRTYVICSVVALYFNVFVLIVQLFEKVPALKALAPTQSEPPFQVAQLAALLLFVTIAIRGVRKFHGEPSRMAEV